MQAVDLQKCFVCGIDVGDHYHDHLPRFCSYGHAKQWADGLTPEDFEFFVVRRLHIVIGETRPEARPVPPLWVVGKPVDYLPPGLRADHLHDHYFKGQHTSVEMFLPDAPVVGFEVGDGVPTYYVSGRGYPHPDFERSPIFFTYYCRSWWPFGVIPPLSDVLEKKMGIERYLDFATKIRIGGVWYDLLGMFNHWHVHGPHPFHEGYTDRHWVALGQSDVDRVFFSAYPTMKERVEFARECEDRVMIERRRCTEETVAAITELNMDELLGWFDAGRREAIKHNIAYLLGC